MPGLPPAYRAIILDQQDQLQRLVRVAGVAPVKALYDRMLSDVTARLAATPASTFSHQQLSGLLAQIKLGLARVQRSMGDTVEESATQVGIHAARTLLTDTAKLEHHFSGAVISLPLLEIGRLHGLVRDQIPSLMRAHATSMARFGAQLVGRMEGELGAGMSLGETPSKLIARVGAVGDLEWYRAERIVRTELSFAAGRGARAAADEQADELGGDLWSRWTEHVSDAGAPLDDRVGVDSEAMHGQVAPPGEPFTQPPTNRQGDLVSESLAGREWTAPPNRPNDRAVLVPWRAHWGVPGWRWEDGTRVPVTETAAARTNAAWMRQRGRVPEIDSGDDEEEIPRPRGVGFSSPIVEEPAEEPDDGGADEPPARPVIGMQSPVLAPLPPQEISGEIPRHEDLADADRHVVADPQAIADHGWHEPPGVAEDLERAARAYEEVADGIESPVRIGVTPRDNLVVHSADDAAKLSAAADVDIPIPVRWERTHAVPIGHVPRGGADGDDPGFRIGVHAISGGDAAEVEPTRAVPLGRPGAAEVAEAGRRAAANVAADAAKSAARLASEEEEREWARRIAEAKGRIEELRKNTTSVRRAGDRQVVFHADKGPKTSEEWYQHDLQKQRDREALRIKDDARARAIREALEAARVRSVAEGRSVDVGAAPLPGAKLRGSAKPSGLFSRITGALRGILGR